MKQSIYLLVLLLLVSFAVKAQTIPIEGIILDNEKLPLAGATVQVKGTTIGTSSDASGKFKLLLNEGSHTLLISFIGFQTREMTVNVPLKTNLTITLTPNVSTLKEVVVSTGYQQLPNERATGSFAKVDEKLLDRVVATDVFSKLENAASGLVINRSAFGEPTITIRGQNTIYGNAQPLIVLDNFPYDGDLNNINPNDVESITVLKDAAAASIWGVRAGNGVIVITTKKGKKDQPLQIQLTGNVTIGDKPDLNYMPLISSAGFIDFEEQLFNRGYYTNLEQAPDAPALSPAVELLIKRRDGLISASEAARQLEELSRTDVRSDLNDYFFRNSVKQQYALNLKGGSPNLRYYFSSGYDNNLMSEVNNSYKRMTLNSALTFTPIKKLELSAGLNYNQSSQRLNNPGISLLSSSSSYADKRLYPYAKLADGSGEPLPVIKSYSERFTQSALENGFLDWDYRPLQELRLAANENNQYDTRVNAGVNYSFNDQLSLAVNYGYERAFLQNENLHADESYFTRNLVNQFSSGQGTIKTRNIPEGAVYDRSTSELNSQTARAQLNYTKEFNNTHLVSLLTGMELKQLSQKGGSNRLYGYDAQTLGSQAVNYAQAYPKSPTGYYDYIPSLAASSEKLDRFRSYYANGSYSYKQRYTLSASGRIDESNLFGVATNQRAVPLWSVGASWQLSNEPFYKADWLPQLKFRATYGYNGNIDKTVTAYTTARYGYDWLNYIQILDIVSPPNPSLRWEKIGILNFGLDFEIKNKLLFGSLEYYHKQGKDLIGTISPDPTTGVMSYRGNIAGSSGQGVDLNLSSNILNNTFKWQTALLFSYATDKITGYDKEDLAYNYTQLTPGLDIVPMQGKPVYAVYSYRFAGLDSNSGDPLGYLAGEKSSDYAKLLSVSPDELVYNGPARPTYFGALRNNFNYKNFGLSFNISYKFGYYFRRNSISYTQLAQTWSGHKDYERRWKQPGDELITNVPSMPELLNSSRDDFYLKSEALVEDASHIRLQDINLSYTLSKSVMKGLPLRSLQFYLYASNLGILWSKNKEGIDPDAVPNGGALLLPAPKSIAVGIKADF